MENAMPALNGHCLLLNASVELFPDIALTREALTIGPVTIPLEPGMYDAIRELCRVRPAMSAPIAQTPSDPQSTQSAEAAP
jgi:hypothetical protein